MAEEQEQLMTYTVIIPCYNGERYLGQAIESVLEQTRPPTGVLVVDDGSTDSSAAIAASYGPPVSVIRKENAGLARARNTGVAAAQNPLVAFLDADDWWLPSKMEKQIPLFLDPEVGLVHSFHDWVDNGQGIRIRTVSHAVSGNALLPLLNSCVVGVLTVVVRRDLLLAARGFSDDLDSAEDWDMWLRLSRMTRFAVVEEVLACYRVHGENMSLNDQSTLSGCLTALERQRPFCHSRVEQQALSRGIRNTKVMFSTRMLHDRRDIQPLISILRLWPAHALTLSFWRVVCRRLLRLSRAAVRLPP